MRTIILAATAALCVGTAYAEPSYPNDYSTLPPGSLPGNPNMWADAPGAHSQAYSNIGHLAILKGALMNVTTDQPFAMAMLPPKYQVTSVYATNCTVSPSGDAGGIYTAASKGGTAIVAAGQTYTGLASANTIQALTVNVATVSQTATQFYFSLTTGTTGGPCDIYVDGIGLQ